MPTTLEKRVPLAQIPTPVSPKKLAHIVLKTANFAAMTDWYIKVLDGRIALKNSWLAFITYDDEHHRIGIANVDRLGQIDPNRSGLDHVSFTYSDLGSLLKNFSRLRSAGILPAWTINHGVTTSFYYKDPDGNKVELQHDNFATAEQAQHYFEHDPRFAANPLGAPFDPDRLIADYEAGKPMSQLLEIPEYPPGVSPPQIIWEMGLGSEPV